MKIKNYSEVLSSLRPFLRNYLEEFDTSFKDAGSTERFQCPNRKEHSNNDTNEACNFYPDEEHFKCFVCDSRGDIFTACHLLEGRPLEGQAFIRENVLYLADKFGVDYELTEETPEEKANILLQKFLTTLTATAYKYASRNQPPNFLQFLEERDWRDLTSCFSFGYLPKSDKTDLLFNKFFDKYSHLKKYINISSNSLINRLIYPIKNNYGVVIGISTRSLTNNNSEKKKYTHHIINVTKKSLNLIYNIDKVRKFNRVYVVEGASSVWTLYKNGLENVVAILGSSFSNSHYYELLRNNIKEIVLCFDGDKAGKSALYKAIKTIEDKSDIKVYVKQLPDDLDPDDYVREYGIEKFKDLKEVSAFKLQLEKYVETEEKSYKESVFKMLICQNDEMIRERMVRLVSKKTQLQKTKILEELKKFESTCNIDADIPVSKILEEKELLAKEVEVFQERSWRTGQLLGLETGFSMFDEKMDGLQDGVYLVCGKWNTGKSAWCLSVALNLLQNNEDCHVLYFSFDDSIHSITIPRAIANLANMNVNIVAKPIFGIQKNDLLEEAEKIELQQAREDAIERLMTLSSRFGIKDAAHGQSLDYVEEMIKIHKILAKEKKIVVFFDFINMIQLSKSKSERETLQELAGNIKRMSNIYQIPIIATAMGTKSAFEGSRLNDNTATKGAVELPYTADAILLLDSDFHDSDRPKLYFYDDYGEARPVIQLYVSKNKLSGFRGKIFYRFYSDCLRFEECDREEQKKFRKKTV